MSQYMAWPTGDGVWHIGTGLTLPPGANLADLNKLLALRHIDRALAAGVEHEHGCATRQRNLRPREVRLGRAAHADQHLARAVDASGGSDPLAHAPDDWILRRHV